MATKTKRRRVRITPLNAHKFTAEQLCQAIQASAHGRKAPMFPLDRRVKSNRARKVAS